MNVGTDHDTAAFAVESIRCWWKGWPQCVLARAGSATWSFRSRVSVSSLIYRTLRQLGRWLVCLCRVSAGVHRVQSARAGVTFPDLRNWRIFWPRRAGEVK